MIKDIERGEVCLQTVNDLKEMLSNCDKKQIALEGILRQLNNTCRNIEYLYHEEKKARETKEKDAQKYKGQRNALGGGVLMLLLVLLVL